MLKSQDGGRCRWTLGSGMSKNNNKKRSTGNNLWAAKPVRNSVMLDSSGMYSAGKKDKKNQPRGKRPVGCKSRTGVDYGRLLGAGTIKQRGSSRSGGWAEELARGR